MKFKFRISKNLEKIYNTHKTQTNHRFVVFLRPHSTSPSPTSRYTHKFKLI